MPGAPRPVLPSSPPLGLRRRAVLGAGVLGALVLAGCTTSGSGSGSAAGTTSSPAATSTASSSSSTSSSTSATRAALSAPTDVATGLDVPWSAAVLPDGSLLVSERDTGQVKRVGSGGVETVGTVDGVAASGEGGLLGLAIDPATFSSKPVLYAYFTSSSDNRVVTIALDGGRFGAQTPIITGIPKGGIHNGGRLKFGPDGFLYVTTGETGRTGLSQDLDSLGGKILRVTTDGAPAPGNPFPGSRVWSYGHRNVQGIGWSANGQMWASEFGQNTWDELNVISPGQNYGWPTVEGIAGQNGFVDPVRQWSTADASPSGVTIGPDGAVLMAALRGQGLWRIPVGVGGSTGQPQKLLDGEYGRIRDVFVGPDGNVWVITNNTGRGQPRAGDDRIVKLPQSLTG